MTLISDGLLLAAALAAVFYCWALSSRLSGLQRQSSDLAKRLNAFDASINEARKTIAEGREIAKVERDSLAELVGTAEELRDEVRIATNAMEKSFAQIKDAAGDDSDRDPLDGLRRMARKRALRDAS